MQGKAYAGFLAACTMNTPDDAFTGCYEAGVNNFTAVGVSGIQQRGMRSISYLAARGFTAIQIASFDATTGGGCAGVTDAITKGIPPPEFSGFKSACLLMMPAAAFVSLTVDKVSNFTATQVVGIQSAAMAAIPAVSVSGFSAEQVHYFDSTSGGGCQGLTFDQISNLTHAGYSGFTASCITQLSVSIIPGIPPTSVPYFLPESCSGFNNLQVTAFPNATLLAFSLDQLVNFVSSGTQGFTPPQLYLLYKHWGKQFITLYSNDHWGVTERYAIGWKNYCENGTIAPIYDTLASIGVGTQLNNVTWFEVTFIKDAAIKNILTPALVANFTPFAVVGLRVGHVHNLGVDVFAAFLNAQMNFMISDTLAALSQDQIQAIDPKAFAGVRVAILYEVPGTTIALLTSKQLSELAKINGNFFLEMPCEQILNITDAQTSDLGPSLHDSYTTRWRQCKHLPPLPPGPPGPTPAPGPGPEPDGPGLGKGAKIGIGLGVTIFVLGALGAGFVFWRMKRQNQYTPIH